LEMQTATSITFFHASEKLQCVDWRKAQLPHYEQRVHKKLVELLTVHRLCEIRFTMDSARSQYNASSTIPVPQSASAAPPPSSSSSAYHKLQNLYVLHSEGVRAFEHGHVHNARRIFQHAFHNMNHTLRGGERGPGAFYFPGSPIVSQKGGGGEALIPLQFTAEAGTCSSTHCGYDYYPDEQQQQQQQQYDGSSKDHDAMAAAATLGRTSLPSTTTTTTSNNNNNNNVYNSNEFFAPHSHLLHLPQPATIQELSLVSLYNLAMTTHLAALTPTDQEEEEDNSNNNNNNNMMLMVQAAKLWRIVYGFQERAQVAHLLQPVHALAVLVNLGHAHGVLGNVAHTHQCAQYILSVLQVLEGRQQDIPQRSYFLSCAMYMLTTITKDASMTSGGSAFAASAA